MIRLTYFDQATAAEFIEMFKIKAIIKKEKKTTTLIVTLSMAATKIISGKKSVHWSEEQNITKKYLFLRRLIIQKTQFESSDQDLQHINIAKKVKPRNHLSLEYTVLKKDIG